MIPYYNVDWFPVIFKDNLETIFLAEACLSFTECSEQFFWSLDLVQSVEKIWTNSIFSSRRKNILKKIQNFGFQNVHWKNITFWKPNILKMPDYQKIQKCLKCLEIRKFWFSKIAFFSITILKNIFETLFRRDEQYFWIRFFILSGLSL